MESESIIGQKFGRWLVKGRLSGKLFSVVCDCGRRSALDAYTLKSGRSKSCGCYANELLAENNSIRNLKHGHSRRGKMSSEYNSWRGMIDRCTNPNHEKYKFYGKRGIFVCPRWLVFENFLEDMGLKPSPSYTIDRLDNTKNYCPENCRWATKRQQGQNKSNNRLNTESAKVIRYFGKLKRGIRLLADLHGVSKSAVEHIVYGRSWT